MKMEENDYPKMLDHLQRYVPHLEKLIAQLKDPKRKSRELQLSKLEGLHSMITDKKRKLKLDTLKKCEDVIQRILQKVHPNTFSDNEQEQENDNSLKLMCKNPPESSLRSMDILNSVKLEAARARLHEVSATPRSPSPLGLLSKDAAPIVIPTEKINSGRKTLNWEPPCEASTLRWEPPCRSPTLRWEPPCESPKRLSYMEMYEIEKPDVYRRAGESLKSPPPNKGLVFDRLGDKIDMSKPPLTAEDLLQLTDSEKEITLENHTTEELQDLREILQSKLQNEEKRITKNDLRHKLSKDKSSKKNTDKKASSFSNQKSVRIEKVYNDPDSKFGNLLSSIDEKLLVDSSGKRKDKSKDSKYDKDLERNRHHDEKKEKKFHERDRDFKHHKKDKEQEHKSEVKSSDKNFHCFEEKQTNFAQNKSTQQESNVKQEYPGYKRLADKYNPRPRKPVEMPKENDCDQRIVETKQNYDRFTVHQSENRWSSPNSFNFDNSAVAKSQSSSTMTPYLPSANSMNFSTPITNHFIPPQTNVHGGNTYLNTFILQNNIANSPTAHSQYQNPINPPQNNFHNPLTNTCLPMHNQIPQPQHIYNRITHSQPMHNQIPPPAPKMFYPYEPINSNDYNLNKIQQPDFYPQYQQQQIAPMPSAYSHQSQYTASPQMVRSGDNWISDHKNDNYRTSLSRDPREQFREDSFRGFSNRDPRIRAREERFAQSNKKLSSPPLSPCKKSVPDVPVNDYLQTDRQKPKDETFISPLDNLYRTGETLNKVGKGYGLQNFRIPKKQPEPASDKLQSDEKVTTVASDNISQNKQESYKVKSLEEINTNDSSIQEQGDTQKPIEEVKKEDSSLNKFEKEINKVLKDEPKEITDDTNKSNTPNINEIIGSLITATGDTTLLQAVLSKLSGKKPDESNSNKFKRIKLIVDSDTDEDSPPKKSESITDSKEVSKKPIVDDSPKKINVKVKELETSEEDTPESDETPETEEDVSETKVINKVKKKKIIKLKKRKHIKRPIVKIKKPIVKKKVRAMKKKKALKVKACKSMKIMETVGERTKQRRRNVKKVIRKYRTELDMLHEDIQGMFIRDGVLTANGRRVCRKPNEQVTTQEIKKTDKSTDDQNSDSSKRRTRTSVPKVVIEKTDISRLVQKPTEFNSESDEPLENLITLKKIDVETSNILPANKKRAIKSKPNYVEEKSDDEKEIYQHKNTTETRDASEHSTIHNSDNITKKLTKKRKRGHSWAIGVIKKKTPWKTIVSNLPDSTPSLENTPEKQSVDTNEVTEKPSTSKIKVVKSKLTKPDVDYFFDTQEKGNCKLCSFKGKLIVHHYITRHPTSEILISRISPAESKKAIEESIASDYENCVVKEYSKFQKFTYQCRFCYMEFKDVLPHYFFDHVTGHTGECRFACGKCKYKTPNIKALRAHLHGIHHITGSIKPKYPLPPNIEIVFGHMCGCCHFIQIDKRLIEKHITNYHEEEPPLIYKINMSIFKEVDNRENCEETNAEVVENTPNINVAGKTIKLEETSNIKVVEEKSVIENINKELPKVEIIEETKIEINEEIQKIKAGNILSSVENSYDEDNPTVVFGVMTSNSQESEELNEQDIQDKILKVSSAIVPKKRFGIDLLNKIRSRLDTRDCEAPETSTNSVGIDHSDSNVECTQENIITHNEKEIDKSEIQVVSTMSLENPIIDKTVVSVQNFSKIEEASHSELLKAKMFVAVAEKPQPNESCMSELNVVEARMPVFSVTDISQNQLPDSKMLSSSIPFVSLPAQEKQHVQLMPPPLVSIKPVHDAIRHKTEEVTIQVGPLSATKIDNHVLYSCNIALCFYSSIIASEFLSHCQIYHTSIQWDGICNFCNLKTNHTKLEDAYNHIRESHNFELGIESEETQTSVNTSKPLLRMRRLSGDKLSDISYIEKEREQESPLMIDDYPIEITNVKSAVEESMEEETHDFPFQISNVTTLTPEEEQALYDSQSAVENNASASSAKLIPIKPKPGVGSRSVAPVVIVPKTTKKVPFTVPVQKTSNYNLILPLNITTSPADKSSNIVLVPSLKPTSQSKKLVLKDVALKPYELQQPRKTERALRILLTKEKLVHFYKCPVYNCSFSSDLKQQFEAHLLYHKELQDGHQVPCLYCNCKTDFKMISIHYDVRHSRCKFCCVYCLYRAVNQSNVEIHQEQEHPNEVRQVLVVPINADAQMTLANLPLPSIENVLPYYVCGQLYCSKVFINCEEFKKHLNTKHRTTPFLCKLCTFKSVIMEAFVKHFQLHDIFYYHCRYCKFGAVSVDTIYKHLSGHHSSLSPKIITRHVITNVNDFFDSYSNVICPLVYELEPLDNNKFIKLITNESCSYITPAAKFEISTPPKEKPLNTTSTLAKAVPSVTFSSTESKSFGSTNDNETITLYKASALENSKTVNINTPPLSSTLNLNEDRVVITSNTLSKEKVQPTHISIKNFNRILRPASPIILNKLLGSTTSVTTLTHDVSQMVATATSEQILKSPESVDTWQPETILSSAEPLLNIQDLNNSTFEETDPLNITHTVDLSNAAQNASDKSNLSSSEDSETQEVTKLVLETRKQGLIGEDLFKCSICNTGYYNTQDFRAHINKCVEKSTITSPKPFKCFHCIKYFKTSNSLIDHIHLHGTERYNCSLCDFKHQHQLTVKTHMKTKHNVLNIAVMPVDANKNNVDEDEFVVRPKLKIQKNNESGSKDVVRNYDDNVLNKPTKLKYAPEEIDALPLHPLFSQEIRCASCTYITKVRANLVRHFQFHLDTKEVLVPTIAPVNPVPCLEKKEKMFDKMTNLAMSSVCDSKRMGIKKENHNILSKEEIAKLPQFVPATKRYVCGAKNCDYLCLEESMLRCHLTTLHGNDDYKCIHCDETISTDKGIINTDIVLQHLRLHDLHLYKCQHCKFIHNLKHKVEQHAIEKHADKSTFIIIVRELEQPVENFQGVQQEEIKVVKPWRCSFCKCRCVTKDEMSTHVLNKHDLDAQFKCAFCNFKSNEKLMVADHFEEKHPGQNMDVIDAFYNILEMPNSSKYANETMLFDTTPLWQRDNSKIKYIRGIPLEEPIIRTNKSLNNLDKAIEAVATSGAFDNNTIHIVKKPKTLKEKMDLLQQQKTKDEIEVDNDEPVTILVDSENERKNLEDMVEVTLDEINQMDIKKLENLNAQGEYGPFGKPLDQQYLCPLCSLFKTRKIESFKLHLYKELHYTRFVCTRCGTTGICLNFLQKHAAQKHVGLSEAIQPISPDNKIENWVEKVIAVQRRLLDNTPTPGTCNAKVEHQVKILPAVSKYFANPVRHQCQHCDYSCKAASDLRKHEKRHWAQKPLRCGYCEVEGVTNYEVLQHLKRAHPNEIPAVLTVPTPSEPIIQPITRKRRYAKVEPISVSSNINQLDLQTSIPKSDLTEEDNIEYKEMTYICHYCSKQSNNKILIKNHWTMVHKFHHPDFKYKTLITKIENAKCFYCDYVGEINGMRKHCYTKHPSFTFALLCYKCDVCKIYCQNPEQLKIHYDEFHMDIEVHQENVEKREATKEEYSCSYCCVQFSTYQERLQHHCKLHSHLKLQDDTMLQYKCPQCFYTTSKHRSVMEHVRGHAKPFQCYYCPLRVAYPSNLKMHQQKEHAGFEVRYKSLPKAFAFFETLKKNIITFTNDEELAKYPTSLSESPIPTKIRITDHTYVAQSSVNSGAGTSTLFRQPNVKAYARKSTTLQSIPTQLKKEGGFSEVGFSEVGFSYYGNKPDLDGVENVKTNLLVNNAVLEMNMLQVKTIFNISPTVALIDIQKHQDET